jgi:hypothetical protein
MNWFTELYDRTIIVLALVRQKTEPTLIRNHVID